MHPCILLENNLMLIKTRRRNNGSEMNHFNVCIPKPFMYWKAMMRIHRSDMQ